MTVTLTNTLTVTIRINRPQPFIVVGNYENDSSLNPTLLPNCFGDIYLTIGKDFWRKHLECMKLILFHYGQDLRHKNTKVLHCSPL